MCNLFTDKQYMKTRIFFVLIFLLLISQALFAEITAEVDIQEDQASVSITIGGNGKKPKNKEIQPLPRKYRTMQLGMNIDDVKKALANDSIFGYRGERDVSLLPSPNRVLIETSGLSFLDRSWFQFYEDKLYTMIFKLDEDRVDFYSMFKTLNEKYGEPTSLSPDKVVWKDDSITLCLERPLTIKYIDTKVFKEIQDKAGIEKNKEEVTRQGFLDSL
ncbi:MAG: hypothetical protein J6T84_09095 [Spirochaetaceae bacterium]|nr:hypothetical protein [Spirochaetaceae bacterium]